MAKSLSIFLIGFLLSFAGLNSYSQTRKLTANLIGGVGIIPGKESTNDLGQQQKIYAGMRPSLYMELGSHYHFKNQLFVGLALNTFSSGKSNYTLAANGLHVRGGFVFIPNPKHVWPYAYLGLGMANVKITRNNFKLQYRPASQNFDGSDLAVNDLISTYGSADFNENAFNVEGGIGMDLVTYRRWSINVQAGLNYYFLSQKPFLKENFSQTASNLSLFTATGGVSYTLAYRNKKQNINQLAAGKNKYNSKVAFKGKKFSKISNQAGVHNPSSGKSKPSANQEASSKPGYLSELKNSHSIEKQKLSPDKKITVLGKIHGSESPSEKIIVSDKKGNVVKTTVTKNGAFGYTNLKPDDYEVKFENPDKKLVMELKTVEDDGMMKVSAEDFNKHNYSKLASDPGGKMVQGRLKNVSTHQYENTDLNIFLMNDKDEVVAKTSANKNGYFAFGKLKADNYTAVVESPEQGVKAEIKVADNDPALRFSAKELKAYNFVALNQNLDDGTIITGKVTTEAGTKNLAEESVLIVDSKGEVQQTKTNTKGYFAFKNLKHEDYQILLETPDPAVKVEAHPVADLSRLIVPAEDLLKHNYHASKGDDVANNVLTGSLNITDHLKPVENLVILLLNDSGNVVQSTHPNSKGQFAFKDLKADNYKAVVNSPEVRLMASLHAPVNDPNLKIENDGLTKFNPATNKYEKLVPEELLTFSGNITEQATNKPLEDHTVFLIDEKGSVAEVSQTNKDGAFFFEGKPQKDYQVVFESKDDKTFNSELDVYSKKKNSLIASRGKNAVVLHYKKEDVTAGESDTSKINRFIHHYKNSGKSKILLRVFSGSVDNSKKTRELDMKRAQEVKKKLVSQGVPPDRIVIEDFGTPLAHPQRSVAKEKDSRLEMILE